MTAGEREGSTLLRKEERIEVRAMSTNKQKKLPMSRKGGPKTGFQAGEGKSGERKVPASPPSAGNLEEPSSSTIKLKAVSNRKPLPKFGGTKVPDISYPLKPTEPTSKVKMMVRAAVEKMEITEFLIGLAKLGFTIPEVARTFGMDEGNLFQAIRSEPLVRDAYVKALEEPNRAVEASLFRKAMGFTTYEKEFDGDGNLKKMKTKQMAPDITAIIFWLKNRSLGKWQDINKVQIELPLADRLTAGHDRIKEKKGELHLLQQNEDGTYTAPTAPVKTEGDTNYDL